MGSGGTKGPGFLSSSLVIKSSKCQLEPHSPAAPRGRMKRGFHGYHLRKRIFRSNQSQRFTSELQPKPGFRFWGGEQGKGPGQCPPWGRRVACALPSAPMPSPWTSWLPGHPTGKEGQAVGTHSRPKPEACFWARCAPWSCLPTEDNKVPAHRWGWERRAATHPRSGTSPQGVCTEATAWLLLFSPSWLGQTRAGVTCEDVFGHHVDLDFHGVPGGVGDLGADVRHLADAHGRQEVSALHPGQGGHAALLKRPQGQPRPASPAQRCSLKATLFSSTVKIVPFTGTSHPQMQSPGEMPSGTLHSHGQGDPVSG